MHPSCQGDTEVLTHGIDTANLKPVESDEEKRSIRIRLGLSPNATVITTVANFRREKALEVLLAAASEVLAKQRSESEIQFIHVGQGPLADEMFALHRELKLGESFRFLGYRTDVDDVLRASDLFVLSSRHEGLPVSLMEAQAMALPTVATSVGGVPEAIDDGIEGLLVEPDNATLLADSITRAITDPIALKEMSVAALKRSQQFDSRHFVSRLEDLYRDLSRRS